MNPNIALNLQKAQGACWTPIGIWGEALGACPPAVLTAGFPDSLRQDLADVLPYLACGEASAVHAFTGRLPAALGPMAAQVLQRIADDEWVHAELIASIQAELPSPTASISPSRLAVFFKRIEANDPIEHLARISALDRAVCQLLQPLLRLGAPVSQAPQLHLALSGLRQDESRHVRVARDMARALGCTEAHQAALNEDMKHRLVRLMSPVAAALQRLGGQ
jgi:hypothetical protein